MRNAWIRKKKDCCPLTDFHFALDFRKKFAESIDLMHLFNSGCLKNRKFQFR